MPAFDLERLRGETPGCANRIHFNSVVSYREYAQYDFQDKGVDSCVRLSPHYYNTEDEVQQVVAVIAQLAQRPR